MLNCTEQDGTGWASALRSRVLFVLFAIMSLGATPLGAGELLAAESYIIERSKLETRSGGLPNRFAVPCADVSVAEFLDPSSEPDARIVLLADGPGVVRQTSLVLPEATGAVALARPLEGTSPALASAQGARAPPAR